MRYNNTAIYLEVVCLCFLILLGIVKIGFPEKESVTNTETVVEQQELKEEVSTEEINNVEIENLEKELKTQAEEISVSDTQETEEPVEKITEDIIKTEEKEKKKTDITEIKYAEFLEKKENGEITTVYFEDNKEELYVRDINGELFKTTNPDYETFKKDLLEEGLEVKNFTELRKNKEIRIKNNEVSSLDGLFGILLLFGIGAAFIWFLTREQSSSSNTISNMNLKTNNLTSNVKFATQKSSKTFNDIAGLKEVKKDLISIVDFLKNNSEYIEAGAKLPKGIILYGPPGTGKTLISKAMSGEANVNFLRASGSDFTEMYVGVGPKRVRELFREARAKAPCIIFIDEIDAVGAKRGPTENSEDKKTINAILTEMDGFTETENILVIGATNRIEDLDPALLRPGRFTDKFCIPLPETAEERLEIINIYSKNKKFAEDVDFNLLAKETIGFSPAQIEALLNEAAIISVQEKKKFIDKSIIEKAMFKMLLHGHAKENQSSRDKDELKLVAWHEAGHALIGKLNGKEVNKVTIVSSTSGAGGVTFTTPTKMGLHSVEDLKNEVKELYGGRIAEFLLFNDKEKVTTGASNDIDRATNIIKDIVTKYGMNETFGLLNLGNLEVDKETTLQEEIKLAKELENDTIKILTENKDKLEEIANLLLEKETIHEKDLDEIIFRQ